MLAGLNVALRFFLELAGVVAVAWWGAHAADGAFGAALALVSAGIFFTIWGLWIAPRARFPQPPRVRLVAGTVLLEGAAVLLALSGATTAALVLGTLVALNALGVALLGDGGLTAEP
jgi:hypothetical protein